MVVNPDAPGLRYDYLLGASDYSLLITDHSVSERDGGDYGNEKVFWYTSGTTGDSKFYGFSSEQVDRMAQTICDTYDINHNDRYFGVMPLWHAHGQGFYWATKRARCETRFGSIKDHKDIQCFQPTFITAIPDIVKFLQKLDLVNLRFVRTASSAMPAYLFKELQCRWDVPVIEAFGMTEALSHCFTNPLHGEQRIGTVGLPDGVTAEIRNQHLWIRGPCTVDSDWVDTGDLAEQDSKGYYRILGRHRDQINVRGIKINPLSIENQLHDQFKDLQQCVIFGTQGLKCLIVGDTDLDQVAKFLRSLGHHCTPVLLEKVDEIPTNSSGKISRNMLAGLF